MKPSTFAIIIALLVMNSFTLWVAMSNRDLIETTLDNIDIIANTFEEKK
jgi:hypothetical protein